MRNKYDKQFEDFVRENAIKYNREELRQLVQKEYNIVISKDSFRRYLNRHKIESIHVIKSNVRNIYKCPVGTERITSEGTFIKVAQPDVWRRKSRVMYEKYHNCRLKDDDYIVFLNRDNTDFRKGNLMRSSRKEIAYLHNNKTFSSNPKLTELGLLSAKLMIKAKEVANNEEIIRIT